MTMGCTDSLEAIMNLEKARFVARTIGANLRVEDEGKFVAHILECRESGVSFEEMMASFFKDVQGGSK